MRDREPFPSPPESPGAECPGFSLLGWLRAAEKPPLTLGRGGRSLSEQDSCVGHRGAKLAAEKADDDDDRIGDHDDDFERCDDGHGVPPFCLFFLRRCGELLLGNPQPVDFGDIPLFDASLGGSFWCLGASVSCYGSGD